MVVPYAKITKLVILFLFSRETRLKSHPYIYIHNCFSLHIFMFQLSSASIPELHTNHALSSNTRTRVDPHETSVAHCATRYNLFFVALFVYIWFFCVFLVSFLSFSPLCPLLKITPHLTSISRLCSICYATAYVLCTKTLDLTKGSRTFTDLKSRNFKIITSKFFLLKKSITF